jgi:MoaA/NifB/PqqE/SkfB family radical SAM enzyme
VAFGGGEPLSVPHCWGLFETLTAAGVALKIETDGSRIDDVVADRLAALRVQCVQISVDGATATTHERVRPGSSFAAATTAIERLAARGLGPQLVFVPTRLNIHEATDAYDLAVALGCSAFITGPMMRIGRAATSWRQIACTNESWEQAVRALRARSLAVPIGLSIYPWDILTELEQRLQSPQAMLLIVPNGRVKLLNALPFSPADLRRDSLAQAWQAYKCGWHAQEVREFVSACHRNPDLLERANEIWPMEPTGARPRTT